MVRKNRICNGEKMTTKKLQNMVIKQANFSVRNMTQKQHSNKNISLEPSNDTTLDVPVYTIESEEIITSNKISLDLSDSPKKKTFNCDDNTTKNLKKIKGAKNNVFEERDIALAFGKKFKPHMKLYSSNRNNYNGEQFYHLLTNIQLYNLSKEKTRHLYEYHMNTENIKLYMDIDLYLKNIPKGVSVEDHDLYFKKIVTDSIKLVDMELAKYDVKNTPIIICTSNRADKFSAHLYYPKVYFESVQHIKAFFTRTNHQLVKDKIIDLSPYKTGCIRMLWNSKRTNNVNLEFSEGINYTVKSQKHLFMDCLVKNITPDCKKINVDLPDKLVIPKFKTKKYSTKGKTADLKIIDSSMNNNYMPLQILQEHVEQLNPERAKGYADWVSVGMCIFNINHTEDGFNLWDKFSQSDESYSRLVCIDKWNSFRKCNVHGIATMKYMVKYDNPDMFNEIQGSPLEQRKFETIKIHEEYLDFNKGVLANKMKEWWDLKIKLLSILSPYNTGKTTLIKNILAIYDPKRVLIVTSRQTLTNDLYGNFESYGVRSYMEKFYDADRIICQIESLPKLLDDDPFVDTMEIPSYDLVILDEIESILAHFRSDTLKEKEGVFSLLEAIIANSGKVLALDGDFNNRAFDYTNHIDNNQIIIENTIKKDKKHFVFTNQKDDFNASIEQDLANGKNISIVSMSMNIAKDFENKYKEKYETVIHISKSDDSKKEKLKKVEEFWVQYQVLIYSPCISCGVSFNIDHFDKMYVVLSSNSTSPRDLLQMCGRVRKYKNNTVSVLLNGLPYKETASFFHYHDLEDHVKFTNNSATKKKMVTNPDTGKMEYKVEYKFGIYERILVHNLTEEKNKRVTVFVPYLLALLKLKNHTYELADKKNVKKQVLKKGVIMKEEIVEARDIDDAEYTELCNRVNDNCADYREKVEIEKHLYKLHWKTDIVDEDFMNKFYGKTNVLHNLRYILDESDINPITNLLTDESTIVDFDKACIKKKIKIIKNTVAKLGYTSITDGKPIGRDDFMKGMEQVMANGKLYSDNYNNKLLFGLAIKEHKTVKAFLGFFNRILKEFGLVIKRKRKNKRVNKKHITVDSYMLTYIDNINKYV